MEAQDWVFSPSDIALTSTVLGRGAFGEVRVAKWRNIDIACKSLHIDSTNTDQVDRDNWRHEISMLSRLRHPNLVLFLGVCEGATPNTTSILTELLPCSLYDIIEVNKSELDLPDILDISLDIAYGLDYLHKHNPQIVHRDISSKNILIGGNKTKIADLGQAKIFGHNTLSRQTGMPGAMAYSAPEVLTGKYSAKIDIFSYGILLAQMITGEYPRIDRREDQITFACSKYPFLKPLLISMVSYQPNERPTAENICRTLEELKENDRYYPISRRTQPEKDIGILGRHWMLNEIEKQCQEVNTELTRTKSLLVAEEQRWRHEAGKVDGINEQLRASHAECANTQTKLDRLHIDYRDLQHQLTNSESNNSDLKAQLHAMGAEMQRQKSTISNYELLLAQQSQDIYEIRDMLHQYKDQYELVAEQLDGSRRSEADLQKRNEQVRLQLDMQVEYVRDLETRLEQALTRWKLEKDALREEKAKFARITAQSASIVSQNKRQAEDIERFEARLKQYADLPLPEEIKERFKDVENDAKQARDEVAQLLRQRDEWIDLKLTLEQTIGDYERRGEDLSSQLLEKDHELLKRSDELIALQDTIDQAGRDMEERNQQIEALQAEILQRKDAESKLNDALRKTRVALTKEKARVQMYENLAATVPLSSSQPAARPEPVVMEPPPQVRIESPYILQTDLIRPAADLEEREIIDLDDRDTLPPVMSTLVPSVLRLAEIQAIHDNAEEYPERTDTGIKHMINSIADKEGVTGLITVMQDMSEDERVVWRGARALRELILKDEAAKTVCYDTNIDDWLNRLITQYPESSVVQSHCMRLVGALAFGNDRYRRKAGERGIMTCVAAALEHHSGDEAVLLHVTTAITNLTHNSMENRMRFVEIGGVELLISMMVRYKESAKLQRQACWAVLSLCGTDEISRTVAQQGGDSAILNAMLYHRFDAGVQQFGCWALSNLAVSGETVARAMKKKGAIEVCRIAIETHPKNAEVVRQARNAMGAFAPLPSPSSGNHK